MKAVKMLWVDTKAVDEATVVMVMLGTHVAKWAARANPAKADVAQVRRDTERSSPRRVATATIEANPAPKALRHNAIASAGAAVAAMSGPDIEIPPIATTSSTRSRVGGMARLGAGTGDDGTGPSCQPPASSVCH
jgi:hypothetical protein